MASAMTNLSRESPLLPVCDSMSHAQNGRGTEIGTETLPRLTAFGLRRSMLRVLDSDQRRSV